MSSLPERREQIRRAHARLIHMVVAACQNPAEQKALEPHLQTAASNGWGELVQVLRRILAGQRDPALLEGLDEEDRVITESILNGLQDRHSLPALDQGADPSLAAPGIASVVHAARQGDSQALAWLGQMASQMERAGGDMARIGAALRPLSRGQEDYARLARGMSANARQLLQGILDELARLRPQ
ncbi:MAG: hypothetical protein ACP5M3_02925 [Acidithiobacillus sp.]